MEYKSGDLSITYDVDRYITQVFINREYDFMSYYPVVIDIGANIGTFALSMLNKANKIYAIEPSEENIVCLIQTIANNKITKIYPFQSAISDKSMVKMLYRNGDAGMGGWKLDEIGDIPINTFTLKDFMDQQNIMYADLVKIDVEGEELKIFKTEHFPKDRIGAIIGEWHNQIEPIQEQLEWLGFKFIDMGNNHFIARKK